MNVELIKSVNELGSKGDRYGKRGLALTAAALATAGVGQAIAYGLAPGVDITAIHVPAEVLSQFASHASSGLPFTSAVDLLGGVAGNILKVAIIVGGGFLMMVKVFKGDDISEAIPVAVGTIVTVGAISLVSSLFASSGEGDTARDVFNAQIERAVVSDLRDTLAEAKVSTVQTSYILAQAAMKRALENNEPLDTTELTRQVKDIDVGLADGSKIDVEPRTVYALERRVWGEPKSAIARQYARETAQREGLGALIAYASAIAGGAGALAGGTMMGLAVIMLRRVRRVRELVSLSKNVSA